MRDFALRLALNPVRSICCLCLSKNGIAAPCKSSTFVAAQSDEVLNDLFDVLVGQPFGWKGRHGAEAVANLEFHRKARERLLVETQAEAASR